MLVPSLKVVLVQVTDKNSARQVFRQDLLVGWPQAAFQRIMLLS